MSATVIDAPVADWIDTASMLDDPYPTYARLRREAPVAYVPEFDRYLVTTFRECFDIEMDQTTFSSAENAEKSTMIRSMGRPMLRKDDPEHKADRTALGTSLRPRTIRTTWSTVFESTAAKYIEKMRKCGPGVDLFHEFAVPYAAENLSTVIGFRGVDSATMMDWSHTLIAGISNVSGDSAVWDQTARVRDEIDQAIDEAIPRLLGEPDASIISSILSAPHPISETDLRANIRLCISGGMNEPSHTISSAVWSLTKFPAQGALAASGERTWGTVFEETARLQSPVGMYPRTVTRDAVVGGVTIPRGSTIGVVIASANRDSSQFTAADDFDLSRNKIAHLAFGNGTHICAGNWLARSMVGDVALPMLFDAFPGLAALEPDNTDFQGWVFRGTKSLPVTWNRS